MVGEDSAVDLRAADMTAPDISGSTNCNVYVNQAKYGSITTNATLTATVIVNRESGSIMARLLSAQSNDGATSE